MARLKEVESEKVEGECWIKHPFSFFFAMLCALNQNQNRARIERDEKRHKTSTKFIKTDYSALILVHGGSAGALEANCLRKSWTGTLGNGQEMLRLLFFCREGGARKAGDSTFQYIYSAFTLSLSREKHHSSTTKDKTIWGTLPRPLSRGVSPNAVEIPPEKFCVLRVGSV